MTKLVGKVLIFYINLQKPLLLILQRSIHSSAPGLGDLPGGKIEENESVERGTIREVKEETGLALKTLLLLTSYELLHPSGITNIEYLFYAIGDTQEILINPLEHYSFRWITLDEIEQSEIHPLTLQAIVPLVPQIKELLHNATLIK